MNFSHRNYRNDGNAPRAFTLIELLVVIAIIAILAAILFPVFAQARSKARQATGTSNAKQVGTAILMYVQDYDEQFPRAGWDCDKPGGVENGCGGTNWINVTGPYHKNAGVFTSPGDASSSSVGTAPNGRISLLFNDLLAHQVTANAAGYTPWLDSAMQDPRAIGLSLAAVNAPADTAVMLEGHCGWSKVNLQGGGQNSVQANANAFNGDKLYPNGGDGDGSKMGRMHREHTISGAQTFLVAGKSYSDWGQRAAGAPFYNGGGIVQFSDGHAKYVKMTDSNGNPIICSTLPFMRHIDPLQRHVEQDGCKDPNNLPGGNSNWN